MNQQCKVCGEPAAGFHFGAFTCEGCKSFFGRSYNNLASITECKNGGTCVINKKNRTACKACRLKKCLVVGMSKSGSRYGRRSNWFKIHCLLQEQQQKLQQEQKKQEQQQQCQEQQQQVQQLYQSSINCQRAHSSNMHRTHRKEENPLLLDEYKNSSSPSVSSPESQNSESSIEISERRTTFAGRHSFRALQPHPLPLQYPVTDLLGKEILNLPLGFHLSNMSLLPPTFMQPPNLPIFSPYHIFQSRNASLANHASNVMCHPLMDGHAMAASTPLKMTATTTIPVTSAVTNVGLENNHSNNDQYIYIHNMRERPPGTENPSPISDEKEHYHEKRVYLDAILKSQRAMLNGSPVSLITRSFDKESFVNSPVTKSDSLPPQDDPIDLSMKGTISYLNSHSQDNDADNSDNEEDQSSKTQKSSPIDLTTKS